MQKFEIVKFGPYRFIGKVAYARTGKSDAVYKALATHYGDWIFKTLDGMEEYATDEIHNAALYSWNRYDEKEQLLGLCVGRFMKAATPVPDDMDYYDIPEILVGKGFVEGTDEGEACRFLRKEIEQQGLYKHSSVFSLSAEIYPNIKDGDVSFVGFYESFERKNHTKKMRI